MKKITSPFEFLSEKYSLKEKFIIDVGCGTGDLVKAFKENEVIAFGIDSKEMFLKSGINPESENSEFVCGYADFLPFENQCADIICYCASFHHIPVDKMEKALEECKRVLKISGSAVFIEPVPVQDSYYEILKLAVDEKEILSYAYKNIKKLNNMNFIPNIEEFYYMERTFSDFEKLLNISVNDEENRIEILKKAKEITEKYCKKNNCKIIEYRYKSICRINILVKN